METVKNWISSICAVSLMTAVLNSVTPNGTTKGIIRMCCAFLLVITLVSPIRKINIEMFSDIRSEYETKTNDKVVKAILENEKMSNEVIESSLEEYICKRAGISENEIEVTYRDGEIERVVLYTTKSEALSAVKDDLGVKREKIVVKKQEE